MRRGDPVGAREVLGPNRPGMMYHDDSFRFQRSTTSFPAEGSVKRISSDSSEGGLALGWSPKAGGSEREVVVNVSVANHGSETVAVVSGEVDADNCSELSAAILERPDLTDLLVVDMSDVSFIDSSGISELLRIQKAAQADNRALRIKDPSPSVHRVLEITGLLSALGIA